MRRWLRFRVVRKARPSRVWQVLSVVIAFLAAFAVSAILIRVAGADVGEAVRAMAVGAFGTPRAVLETLAKATPVLLTGLAVTLAFRGRIWNIGAEGQLFAGAAGAYWAYATFQGLPRPWLLVLVVVFGFIGGALCGLIPGLLRAKFGVDEIIVTVMLNYIVLYLISFLLSGVWREPGSYYSQTAALPEEARFPVLVPRSPLHIGFVIALVTALLVYVLLEKTPLGYEIRAMGFNPRAAQFKGVDVARTTIVALVLSGGIAGLAGTGEVFGVQYRLRLDLSPGYGYTGIIVAMLGGLQPFGVVLAAVFFGALTTGAVRMKIATGVPASLADAIQAIVLLFLVSAQVLANYEVRRIEDAE